MEVTGKRERPVTLTELEAMRYPSVKERGTGK